MDQVGHEDRERDRVQGVARRVTRLARGAGDEVRAGPLAGLRAGDRRPLAPAHDRPLPELLGLVPDPPRVLRGHAGDVDEVARQPAARIGLSVRYAGDDINKSLTTVRTRPTVGA